MITQEQFDNLELRYGCGYYNVCWEHACPCAITTEHKGLQESIYKSLVEEAQRVVDLFEEEDLCMSFDRDDEAEYDDDDDNDYEDEEYYTQDELSAMWHGMGRSED